MNDQFGGDPHTLSGAYALDALDDVERRRFERHLAECADCRAEVRELSETAAMLSHASSVAPPPALRDRVLAEVATVRPLPPVVPEPSGGRQRRWFPLLVAASVALLLGLAAAVWQPWVADEPVLSAADRVLQAQDAQRVSVDLGELGSATVVRSVAEGRAVIVTEDMVEAPSGRAYELWLMHDDGTVTPAGLMPDDPDQTLVLEGDATQAVAAGITVEPDAGSEQPTSDPIAMFEFADA